MSDTELLVNCRNQKTAERPIERATVPSAEQAAEERRAGALAYLKSRTFMGSPQLDQEDLRNILVLLGEL